MSKFSGLFKPLVISSLLSFSQVASSAVSYIAIIAVDDNGEEYVENVESSKFGNKMSRLLSEVNKTVTSQTTAQNFRAGGWKMKKFSLGLGMSGSIGIGPWDIGAALRHRVYFTKK